MTDDNCAVCGKRAVHTHHRKMRSQGGGDEPFNLLRVCLDDHNWIHANPSEAYARGLLVHSWADPALVDVFANDPPMTHQEMADAYEVTLQRTGGDHSRGVVEEGAACPTCKRRVPHKKKASTPKSQVWSTRVPLDEKDGKGHYTNAEMFSELVDAAAEHHGLTSKPHYRYWTMLYALTLLLQAERGELPVGP